MENEHIDQIVTLLQQTDIFSGLDRKQLQIIAEESCFLELEEKESIFREKDPGDSLFIVESGKVIFSRSDEQGSRRDLAEFLPGELFGDVDLIQGQRRNADAEAGEKTRLLKFPEGKEKLPQLFEDYPPIAAKILHSFLVIMAGRIRSTNKLIKENSPVVQELRKQVYGDKLTGLYNRTFLEENLAGMLNSGGKPSALLLFKPDNFKAVNDTYGHEAGDQTLQFMARTLEATVREPQVVVRYMGNELGAVLPGCGRHEALDYAKNLSTAMKTMDLTEIVGNDDFHISISSGIAVYPEHGETAEKIIEAAHTLPLIGRGRGGGMILFPEDAEKEDS